MEQGLAGAERGVGRGAGGTVALSGGTRMTAPRKCSSVTWPCHYIRVIRVGAAGARPLGSGSGLRCGRRAGAGREDTSKNGPYGEAVYGRSADDCGASGAPAEEFLRPNRLGLRRRDGPGGGALLAAHHCADTSMPIMAFAR